jgi:hypothetical protein
MMSIRTRHRRDSVGERVIVIPVTAATQIEIVEKAPLKRNLSFRHVMEPRPQTGPKPSGQKKQLY